MKNIIVSLIISLLIFGCGKDSNTTDNDIINNTTENYSPNTAHFNFTSVDKQAKTLDSKSRLKSISGINVKIDGTAESWVFKYSSVNIGSNTSKYFYFRSFDKTVKCDSIIERETTVGDAYISETWFNSDKAIAIAENNGGKNFREENPDNAISASLSQAAIYNASPTWYIQYSSKINKEKHFRIRVNAVNGSFILF